MPTEALGAETRLEAFAYHLPIATRWADNDSYGHINNAHYYRFFEQVIMHFLEREHHLSGSAHGVQVFTVENGCHYHRPMAYPEQIVAGLRVLRLGRSSVQYQLGLFVEQDPLVRATGYVVDVFVAEHDQRPTPIPAAYRQALSTVLLSSTKH